MLAPWKKSYDQPSSILKSRDISLPTKVYLVKAMVFPVVMYGCIHPNPNMGSDSESQSHLCWIHIQSQVITEEEL